MNTIVKYFKDKGMINPLRSINLIQDAIRFNNLNLEGLVVFTEAASKEFIYTPIIAAMAGAKRVYAITEDSKYDSKEEVKKDTLLFAKLCGVEDKLEIVFNKEKIGEAHIVTNLGFVRPIDKITIDLMKKDAVIPYMCEAWEVRERDIDIKYCRKKDIPVMGTNENFNGLNMFNFSGPLAIKMLFDAGIEVYKSKIVIVSSDKFGKVIYDFISKFSKDVTLIDEINNKNKFLLKNLDSIIIADYIASSNFIGKTNAQISAKELKKLSGFITVIQFAGNVDIDDLKENNINFYPEYKVGNLRMGKTLAYLGSKPVIYLHCAGLKVGEKMYKMRLEKLREDEIYDKLSYKGSLCQKICILDKK